MNRLIPLILAIFAASPAAAHLAPGSYGSIAAGLFHPLFGPDHVLTMVVAGLWSSTIGGRALWIIPSAFIGAMLAGFGLALAGLPLPAVEPVILASIIVLGLAVTVAPNVGLRASVTLVGIFALFHGHAHGGELGEAAAAKFGVGFVLATVLLHLGGICLGQFLERATARGNLVTRGLCGLIAATGMVLAGG